MGCGGGAGAGVIENENAPEKKKNPGAAGVVKEKKFVPEKTAVPSRIDTTSSVEPGSEEIHMTENQVVPSLKEGEFIGDSSTKEKAVDILTPGTISSHPKEKIHGQEGNKVHRPFQPKDGSRTEEKKRKTRLNVAVFDKFVLHNNELLTHRRRLRRKFRNGKAITNQELNRYASMGPRSLQRHMKRSTSVDRELNRRRSRTDTKPLSLNTLYEFRLRLRDRSRSFSSGRSLLLKRIGDNLSPKNNKEVKLLKCMSPGSRQVFCAQDFARVNVELNRKNDPDWNPLVSSLVLTNAAASDENETK